MRGADALGEGFRPGVMARLGLGFDVLQAVAPSYAYAKKGYETLKRIVEKLS